MTSCVIKCFEVEVNEFEKKEKKKNLYVRSFDESEKYKGLKKLSNE